jgi:hypothetical protein
MRPFRAWSVTGLYPGRCPVYYEACLWPYPGRCPAITKRAFGPTQGVALAIMKRAFGPRYILN